jgi:hypothetical protein
VNDIIETEKHRLATCVARFTDPLEPRFEYVLCVWKRDKDDIPTEWVVWMHNKEDHGFYYGHYCRTLSDAVKIFEEKKGKALLNQLKNFQFKD